MNERQIFRTIQHIPRVWGVTYPKLFGALGAGLLITTAGFSLSSGAGTMGKVAIIGAGAVITIALYGVCFWFDKTDALDRPQTPFLKNEMNCQSMSLQRVRATSQGNESGQRVRI